MSVHDDLVEAVARLSTLRFAKPWEELSAGDQDAWMRDARDAALPVVLPALLEPRVFDAMVEAGMQALYNAWGNDRKPDDIDRRETDLVLRAAFGVLQEGDV